MKHYVEKVQQPGVRRGERWLATLFPTSRKWALGYFDKVTTIIQGGASPLPR